MRWCCITTTAAFWLTSTSAGTTEPWVISVLTVVSTPISLLTLRSQSTRKSVPNLRHSPSTSLRSATSGGPTQTGAYGESQVHPAARVAWLPQR